jgi:hypothetical protein
MNQEAIPNPLDVSENSIPPNPMDNNYDAYSMSSH